MKTNAPRRTATSGRRTGIVAADLVAELGDPMRYLLFRKQDALDVVIQTRCVLGHAKPPRIRHDGLSDG